MRHFAIAFVLVAIVPAWLMATGYGTKYVTPAVVTVPAYGGQFNPPQAQVDRTDEVLEELRRLNANMERLIQLVGEPVPQAQQGPRSGVDVLSATCARCHAADVAEKKGGGFALTDAENRLAPLTPGKAVRVFRMVDSGEMPPKGSGSLSDADRRLLLDWLEK